LTEKIREQWNLLIGKKGEKEKFSRYQGNIPPTLPPSLPPSDLLSHVVSLALVIPLHSYLKSKVPLRAERLKFSSPGLYIYISVSVAPH